LGEAGFDFLAGDFFAAFGLGFDGVFCFFAFFSFLGEGATAAFAGAVTAGAAAAFFG